MTMTLGDAFNLRKKLYADITNWTNRLSQSGQDRRDYTTLAIEGEKAFVPKPGTEKNTYRHYTIEECREKLKDLLAQDQKLALEISLTNQKAKAKVEDLNGQKREFTVPELLVLKNEIIPKMEQVAHSMPTRANGVNIFDEKEKSIKHRTIRTLEKKKQTLTEKGNKVEETKTTGYQISETTDYGIPQREAWNEIDRIHEFAERVKQAINEANKTELVSIT